jgi:hypothetical protein
MSGTAWFGRFNQSWASSGTLNDPTGAQANSGFAFIGQAPPTVELFNSVLQWNDNKDNWLYNQIAQVLLDAGLTPDPANINQLLTALQHKRQILLTANTTVYVDIGGNDSTGTGSSTSPWATIQKAYNWLMANFNLAGYTATIQLKSTGTYAPVSATQPINGAVIINGDPANPRNYIIRNSNGTAVAATGRGVINVVGVSLETTGGGSTAYGLGAAYGGLINFTNCAFGPCAGAQIASVNNSVIANTGTTYSIYGSAPIHAFSSANSMVNITSVAVTITGTPTYAQGFAIALAAATLQVFSFTFTGTTTGKHAAVDSNSVMVLSGVNPDTLFPGNVASTATAGGLFI